MDDALRWAQRCTPSSGMIRPTSRQAVERAVAEKSRLHRIRSDYLRAFGELEQSRPQLKFHELLFVSGTAKPGEYTVSVTTRRGSTLKPAAAISWSWLSVVWPVVETRR